MIHLYLKISDNNNNNNNYYYYSLEFFNQRKLMVFRWRLSDSKSPQVSRTLLSILAVFNNAVVWMVSTRPPTSKSSRSFINSLVTVPKAPITIGIIITFMFHSFFNSLARSRYLSLFTYSFSFILWLTGTAKSTILQIFFFFFVDYYKIRSSGRVLLLLLLSLLLFLLLETFSYQHYLIVFHCSLSDDKPCQVSKTLLSILADLSNAVICIVSTRPFIYKSSNFFYQSLSDCTETTNYSWYNRHFYVPEFFYSLSRSRYLSYFSLSFIFTLWTANSTILQVLFFCWSL